MKQRKNPSQATIRGPVADLIWGALKKGKVVSYTRRRRNGSTELDVEIE